ncbi:MAG: DegV family protein [Anaerolineales bacterium]|nr:DegV family protein [Anaerolineales bacterium]
MPAFRTAIVTDSTCDLPEAYVSQYNITVVPTYVIWGEEIFRDRIDMQPEEFYTRLATDPVYPSSSCPTPDDFAQTFARLKSQGAEEILVLTVSGAMSATYQTAIQASSTIDIPVHVVDSRGPTMTLGWQVLAAARALEAGKPIQAVLERIDQVRKRLVQLVFMDSIEYLYKGGRIGMASNLLSSALKIKPVIQINHETGLVESLLKVRTRTKAVEAFYQEFLKRIGDGPIKRIAVLHGNVSEEAQDLIERVKKDLNPTEIITNITGPVLGINTGPRALALCGYSEY